MTDKWPGDGRREVMQDFAEDAAADGKHFFYVRIPGDWKPVERGLRFEDPLIAALEAAGVGTVTGGGSQLGEGSTIECCGIDLVVSDRSQAIQIVRDVLQACACPRDAVLEEYLPEYSELPVWPADD